MDRVDKIHLSFVKNSATGDVLIDKASPEPFVGSAEFVRADAMTVPQFIQMIARVASAVSWQAGVSGMETAGSLISYLAAHPDQIDAFIGNPSFADLPAGLHALGCLTWHGQNGKIYAPSDLHFSPSEKGVG